jgi:DNA-binding NarL/FixJ family response regulator
MCRWQGMRMSKPRVLLADDHSLVLEGFRRILDDQCDLVGMVEDGRALLEAAQRVQPDIVILDVSMPLLNGIDAATQLKKIASVHQGDLCHHACRCGLCPVGV